MIGKQIILRDGTSHGRIINGCWQFSEGHSTDTEAPTGVLQKYIDAGYTVFDGADIYTKGTPLAGDVFDLERYEMRHRDIMKYNLNKDEN